MGETLMMHRVLLLLKNRELTLVSIGQLVSMVSGFIFIKLVSHYVSVQQYGLYALALTLAGFAGLFPFAIFDQAVTRYIPIYRDKNTYAENYTNVLLINMVWLGVYAILFLVVGFLFQVGALGEIKAIGVSLLLYVLVNTFRNTLLNIESSNRRRGVVAASKIFEGGGRITLLVLIILCTENTTAAELLYLSVAVFAINAAYLLYRNRKDFDWARGATIALTKENLKSFIVFSLPLFIWAGFGWMQSYFPIWFLKWNDAEGQMNQVGQFAMINTLGGLLPAQLVGVVSMYISPIIYQNEPVQPGFANRIINKAMSYLGAIYAAVFAILLFFHDDITVIVTSTQYVRESWLLPYAFLAACFLSAGQIMAIELFAYSETRRLLLANIAPSLATLLIGYLLIPKSGVMGAVACIFFAGLFYMCLVYIAKNRSATLRSTY